MAKWKSAPLGWFQMMRNTESKIGYFELPVSIIRCQPEKLKPVFSKVIVITAVNIGEKHRYLAYSDEFEWVPNGSKVPEYECGRRKNMMIYFKRKA